MCSKIALYWSLRSIVCGSQTWVIVALRASPNSRFEPTRQLHVTFISLWWFLLNQLPRNSGCSYASNASKVADNIKMERSCNMLIVKEEVLRISNVLKLFLWNVGVIIDRSFLLNKYVLYIQLFVLVSPDCRTLWDYELNWFDFFCQGNWFELILNDEYTKAEGEHISVTLYQSSKRSIWIILFLFFICRLCIQCEENFVGNYLINLCTYLSLTSNVQMI